MVVLWPALFVVHLMLLPISFVIPFAKMHAFLTSYIQSVLFHAVIWYFHHFLGIKLIVSGSALSKTDKCRLIISNHPTTFDWLWVWFLQHSQCSVSKLRYVMNADGFSFKTIPVAGHVVSQLCHLFIVKNSKNAADKCMRAIKRTILYYRKTKSRVTLVLYPEGGTLYEGSKTKSTIFANKLGITPLKRVNLPRERGFSEIIKHADVDCIYDVTVAMPEMGDGCDQYDFGIEKMVMTGKYPKTVHMHIRRYPVKTSLRPQTDEPDALSVTDIVTDNGQSPWLRQVYREKDEMLEKFFGEEDYSKRQFGFDGEPLKFGKRKTAKLWMSLWFWLFWFTAVLVSAFYFPLFRRTWLVYILLSSIWSMLEKFGYVTFGVERLVILCAGISVRFIQKDN